MNKIALLIAMCVILAGCKVSRDSQVDKERSETNAQSTEINEEKATTGIDTEAWRFSDVLKSKGITLTDFVGKINADGSLEGSASSVNAQSHEQSNSRQKDTKRERTLKITKRVLRTVTITKRIHYTRTVTKVVTRNIIPWWVWLTGAAAVAVALFLKPQSLFVKLKNLIK